jgi:hypothetical protein
MVKHSGSPRPFPFSKRNMIPDQGFIQHGEKIKK